MTPSREDDTTNSVFRWRSRPLDGTTHARTVFNQSMAAERPPISARWNRLQSSSLGDIAVGMVICFAVTVVCSRVAAAAAGWLEWFLLLQTSPSSSAIHGYHTNLDAIADLVCSDLTEVCCWWREEGEGAGKLDNSLSP